MKIGRLLTLAVFFVGGGCAAPTGPTAQPDAIARIERASYAVPEWPGLTVSYLRAGDRAGRRVVFVHGTPGAADGWADYLLNVPSGLEYVALDRPGFGMTKPGAAEPSLERQALALAPLLETRDGKRAIVVGHSLGGPIAARAAVDFPDKVGGLLILAGSLDPALERVHPMQPVGEWWGVRTMLPNPLRNANRELLPLKGELSKLASRLGEITVPVTIVHGTADTLVPIANVDFMRTHLAGSEELQVETLAGQGHFLPWEQRPVVERALAALAVR